MGALVHHLILIRRWDTFCVKQEISLKQKLHFFLEIFTPMRRQDVWTTIVVVVIIITTSDLIQMHNEKASLYKGVCGHPYK